MQEEAILTTGVVIIKGNKVLLVKHTEKAKHQTGYYGIPAGRPKENESLEDTCIRKVKEETGLTISREDLKKLGSEYSAEIERESGKKLFSIVPFTATKFGGELTSTEKEVPEWIDIEEAKNLKLLPNMKEIIEEAVSANL
jgi:ADP-ribose pyrophosphatase YjhB (NUDIX family)